MKRLPELLPEFAKEALAEHNSDVRASSADALIELNELLSPVEPSREARQRLVAAVAAPPLRYAPFFDRLTALLDLPLERVERVLSEIGDRARWEAALPGVQLMHFSGGPSLASADVGLVRIEPGHHFPNHRHRGEERLFVLEGGYVDSSGREFRAGDKHVMAAGTSHSYEVSGRGLLAAVVLFGGISIEPE
jgi:anti-sigma factor ChrR (cupin superfamily)